MRSYLIILIAAGQKLNTLRFVLDFSNDENLSMGLKQRFMGKRNFKFSERVLMSAPQTSQTRKDPDG